MFLKSEVTVSLSIPSAEQKRPAANGKSKETIVAVTPSKPATLVLKLRVSVAHTPVSKEGTTIISCLVPVAPPTTTSPKPSEFTTVTAGAVFYKNLMMPTI